ncbi:substrate-binding domain-containing protein [Alicyclobacillus acidocaldarius]|uniref:substrate-binding domain-containing protein n=1 Tax=Alicyclobacillus acidocaldarius TaxID=405212 RepID=UPI0011D1DC90
MSQTTCPSSDTMILQCPALTTVRQPWFELGRRVARMILNMMAGEPAHSGDKHLIPDLMERDSVRNMHV